MEQQKYKKYKKVYLYVVQIFVLKYPIFISVAHKVTRHNPIIPNLFIKFSIFRPLHKGKPFNRGWDILQI